MTAIPPIPEEVAFDTRNPINLNYSRPTGFKFSIFVLPQVSFFCQSVILPGITLGIASQATPIADVYWPGEKLTFEELRIKFIIQSDFANYRELYSWFMGLGDPISNDQYQEWIDKHDWRFPYPNVKNKNTVSEQFSDATLTVLSANNVPIVNFHFMDLFPVRIEGVEFDISSGQTQYLTVNASFRYQYFYPVVL